MADDEERLKKEEERLLRAMTPGTRKLFKPSPAPSPTKTSTPNIPATSLPRSASKVGPSNPALSTTPTQKAPTNGLVRSPSKVLTDDEIRTREADRDRERERLRSLEKNLVKNSYSALSSDGISETDALVSTLYRSPQAGSSSTLVSGQIQPAPQEARSPSAQPPKSEMASAPAASRKPADDLESLLAQLDVAASSSSKPKLNSAAPRSAADSAAVVLLAAKNSVGSLLSSSMARDPPSPQNLDDAMALYIRNIVGQVKPVKDRGAKIATAHFEFDFFARDVDQLVKTVLQDLHFFLQQTDREQLAAQSDDLLLKSLAVVDAAGSVAAGSPQSASEIAAKQNGFVSALQKLIETLTAAAKRQIEMSASLRDAAHNLAECVQETAVYAQQIAEQLKQPLLEIQAFKQSLTSMISAIKKAHQYVDSAATQDAIMAHTRRVLEASLKLQSGDAEAASAHVDVLHEVTALLKTLMSLLKK